MASSKKFSRRRFLKRGAALASAGAAVPYFIPSGVLAAKGKQGANDRVHTGNLFFVDRIDCEDEALENTPLERLVPKFINMKNKGFAMPTLLIRCAGKTADGVTRSPSSMKAVNALRKNGSPIGIHVHNKGIPKKFEHYFDKEKMRIQLAEACGRFKNTFGVDPTILGMGDLACSCEKVAALPSRFGIQLNIADIISPKCYTVGGKKVYDYSTENWRTDFPLFKHNMWWIPLGTDGMEGPQGSGWLGLNSGQNARTFRNIFSRYKKIAESNPEKLVIISSVVHPPETLTRWDAWVSMHNLAIEHGFRNITSTEALEMLEK